MGWSGASSMVDDIICNVNKIPNLTEKQKIQFYLAIIDPIEDQDGELCDLLYGDPLFKEALLKVHPDWNR